MQDFLLTEAERELRAKVRGHFAASLGPRVAAIEEQGDWDALRAAVREAGAAGLLVVGVASEPGSGEASLVAATLVAEEAARVNYAFESTVATSLSCAVTLARHAAEPLRSEHLPRLTSGEDLGAICITEPGIGSDTSRMATRIREDGEELVLDGLKRYISNAGVADVYVVYGISDWSAAAQKGMSAVAVPASTAGLTFPRRYTLMGRRGCVVGEVALDGVRVPRANLLGALHGGFKVMLGMFNFERVLVAGTGLGIARAALEEASAHAERRESFGAPLATKQLIWSRLADMSCRIEAAELLTYRAARLYDRGVRGKDLMAEAAMAKLVSSEAAVACADAAVQVLGGDGLTREHGPVERLYRDARALPIVGGTSEMNRYLIASRLTGVKPAL